MSGTPGTGAASAGGMTVHVGTSGWTYPSWTGTFYPPGVRQADRLAHYASRLDTVELNGSHYRWPADTSFAAWRDTVPDGFQIAVKASRYLSHFRKLKDPQDWVDRIAASFEVLGDKAGPLLVQLPADLARNDERLAGFLELLPARILVAIEPQHASWFADDVYALLDEHGAGFVVSVIAGREPILRGTGRLAYVRFHNSDPAWRYGGSFSDDELSRWPERLAQLTAGVRPGYCYFNNDNHGYAAFNAETLTRILRGES